MKIKSGMFMLSMFCGFVGQAFAVSDENRPEYQKEYDAYLRDLEVIAQTGKAPANPDLEADLAKMSSNDKILLTVPGVPSEEALWAENDAKILNKVEVIHVPEEFREEYADIYREERGILTTPSLVKEVKPMDEKEAKVSEHQNPFQMKTKPQDDKSSDDSLVNAYFNPFGQPFVKGDPSAVKSSDAETAQSKTAVNNSSATEKTSPSSTSSKTVSGTSSRTTSHAKRNPRLTSSPIGIKNSMFVR